MASAAARRDTDGAMTIAMAMTIAEARAIAESMGWLKP